MHDVTEAFAHAAEPLLWLDHLRLHLEIMHIPYDPDASVQPDIPGGQWVCRYTTDNGYSRFGCHADLEQALLLALKEVQAHPPYKQPHI